jgi:O-antigen ligase
MSRFSYWFRLTAREKFLYSLIFLFPIAGNSVKSWTGVFFGLLFFFSLMQFAAKKPPLSRPERILLRIIGLIFFSIAISNFANHWDYTQFRGLGVYGRWALFVSIYFCIRLYKDGFFWLANGSVIGSAVLLLQCVIDIFIFQTDRAYGVYESPGLIAIQALLFAVVSAGALKLYFFKIQLRVFYSIGILLSLCALILSGSRSTYVTTVLLVLALLILIAKSKKFIPVFFITVCTFSMLYGGSRFVSERVDSGLVELRSYLATPQTESLEFGSVGARLEMWKVSLLIAQDFPYFGVGWRNFQNSSKPYAEQKLVSPSATEHPHPHNMYLDTLVTTGVVGLCLILALLIYVVYVARKAVLTRPIEGTTLLVFSIVISINGISEGGALIYGNSLSFLLIYLGVLFSSCQPPLLGANPRDVRH